MKESSCRQQAEMERWPRIVGQLFQAEVEKAVMQGLMAAFRTLAERLPQLLAEGQRPQPPPPADDTPETPCVLRLASEESEPAVQTVEQPAAAETTAVEFAATSANVADAAARARLHLRRAVEAARAGNDERALDHFTRSLRLEASAAAHLGRGQLLRRLGRTEEALADVEEALRLDARLAAAYYLRAALRMRRRDNAPAIADLTRFLELEPDHALAHQARGLAHANEGDYDRAISDFGRALRLRPSLLSARYHRALAYRLKGDYAFAVFELTKVLEQRPDFARAYFERALARLALEEHDRALEDFDRAVELAPQEEEIRTRRQQALQAREQARKTTPASDAKGPQSPPRASGPSPSPAPPPSQAGQADPTFLQLVCPACSAAARVSWKRLDRLFHCRRCARVFRINREGRLTEIESKPAPSRGSRLRRRGIVSVAVLLLIVVLAGCLYSRYRPRPALAELPNDLASRSELWGKAWLNNDRLLLRRLTSPTHDRQLHPWLTRHPPPANRQGETSSESKPSPEIHLQNRTTRPHEAVVIVRITAAARKSPQELHLDWVERGDIWYFVPSLKR
jgi:tetratricopeptide (TPR) repeat protein